MTGSQTKCGSSNPRGLPLYRGDMACASAAGWWLLWSDIRTGEMRNYQCRVRNGCESLELGMHTEEAGAVQSCLKKAEKTALMFLMVTAGRLNDTSILFLPVYPFPFSSFTSGREKKTSIRSHHLCLLCCLLDYAPWFLLKANFAKFGFWILFPSSSFLILSLG